MKQPPTQRIAYSYVRFSTPEQARGDSLRRQTEAAASWCERNGVRLDSSLSLRDLGKSAYLGEHRKNADRYALAAFLKLVQEGRVARGSYLVIESLDRLTREHVRAGLMLVLGLIKSGISIVQLSPSELVYDEKADEMALMLAIVELARGHRESKRKSDLVGAAWVNKRKAAREGRNQPPRKRDGRITSALTARLPGWIEERDGKMHLIPERAAAVRRVFELAAAGYGVTRITKKLTDERVLAVGWSGRWTHSYVGLLLHDRRVIGEFQPRLRDRTADGEPIVNYYPAAVKEKLWLAARAGAVARRDTPGRVGTGRSVNPFANLLRDAHDGGRYVVVKRMNPTGAKRKNGREPKVHRSLVTAGSIDGLCPSRSFPFAAFEPAILSCLREIDPRDILEPGGGGGDDEVLTLSAELSAVEEKLAEIEAELLNGDVATLAKVLRRLEERKRELAAALAEARQRAASPLSAAWGDCRSLLSAIDSAPDPEDVRMRLRSALRRVVKEIWLLVVPHGRCSDRLCAVQLFFTDSDQRRGYLILSQVPRSNGAVARPAKWWVRSLAEVAAPGDLDLRKRSDARKLEAALTAADLDEA